MKIAIVGGGIGGLTAALALSESTHDITVFERSAGIREIGAGVQISPNAGRLLHSLGLGAAYSEISVHPHRVVLRRWEDDSIIRATDLDESFITQHHVPLANVARNELVEILGDAVAARSNIALKFSAHVVAVEPGDSASVVQFSDGLSQSFDIVIGADGIHSVVRPCVGGVDKPRFSGSAAYRALVPRSAVEDLPIDVTNRMGPDRHVVSYFIGRNRSHLNLVCISPENSWETESWTEQGTKEDLYSRFEGWSPDFLSLLGRVEEPIFRWALYDREPLEKWGMGTTTLLGDACHPMLPFMAQGSCQAIEDAIVLARCLKEANTSDAAIALRRYEDARQGRTAQVQTSSLMNRDLFHMVDGQEQKDRDLIFSISPPGMSILDWVYEYDALTVSV
ncbi:MAG: NAD(P)-binding protein [Actinobacteria bacterium]|nr:NAD(P)-binding protein [Actinomycetota bacterium]MTA53396.1 NAD(P)-binding protein [Actinomycetota bacterium]